VKKVVHEDIPKGSLKFAVGASPGFRTAEFVDLQTGDCYVFTFDSIVAAQLARALMEGDPDPEQLTHDGTDSKVVRLG
jgi:hypothetical protein